MAAFNVSLANLQIALNDAWSDGIQGTQYMAKVEALRAQLQRQTARIDPLISGSGVNAKNLTAQIQWLTACAPATASCSDECTAATYEVSDDSETVTLSCLREASFKDTVKRYRAAPHKLEESLALNMMVAMKSLDEYLTGLWIAFLEANKGEHQYELPVGSNNADDWEIPASEWGFELIPHFIADAELSRFMNPYMLDGANFYAELIRAQAFNANSDGKGEWNLLQKFDFVQDLVNMSATAPNKTFMVNASAAAFLTGNYWSTSAVEMAPGHRVWKQASRNLPGVYYDVHELTTCTSDDFVLSYKLRAYGLFKLNPLGCDEDITGILAFEKLPGV
jgi:hypothetical protein